MRIGPRGKRLRLRIGLRHDDETAQTQKRLCGRRPGQGTPIGERTGPCLLHRIEADRLPATQGRTRGTFRRMHAIPDRRRRLLKAIHLELDRLAAWLAIDARLERLQHEWQRRAEDGLGLRRIDSIKTQFRRRRAAPEADEQASAAQLVQHTDFLRQPQRVIERQRIDHRPEPQLLGAHGDSGQKNIGRRCHAKRGAMMLGQMIGVKASPVIGLDQRQPLLHELRHRQRRIVQMIEDPDFHRACHLPLDYLALSGPRRPALSRAACQV